MQGNNSSNQQDISSSGDSIIDAPIGQLARAQKMTYATVFIGIL
jgi:hypothetical protein